ETPPARGPPPSSPSPPGTLPSLPSSSHAPHSLLGNLIPHERRSGLPDSRSSPQVEREQPRVPQRELQPHRPAAQGGEGLLPPHVGLQRVAGDRCRLLEARDRLAGF